MTLAQPIYRYATEAAVDGRGCCSSFVQGTDPEVYLILESDEVKGTGQWHFGLAPACVSRAARRRRREAVKYGPARSVIFRNPSRRMASWDLSRLTRVCCPLPRNRRNSRTLPFGGAHQHRQVRRRWTASIGKPITKGLVTLLHARLRSR